ncbi:CPBP family glutamic-type intramembrane protease [Hoeflea sp. AS60]|uniref:CPBP family glutamic-type intramembrane protease n=1 Tax=Hoeflea sp. AS60 TaxID=3135780 RepID=UPI00318230CA
MPQNDNKAGGAEFFFFERANTDFPYYRGVPVGLSPVGWIIVLVAVAAAYWVFTSTQLRLHSGLAGFIPPFLLVLIPLGALAIVAGSRAPLALFRKPTARDFGLMIAFFVLNAVVTIIVGNLLVKFFHTVGNPIGDMVASAAAPEAVLIFAWSAVQLLGEEIFTILPFLAILTLLDRFVPRKLAVCLAALVAAIPFAAIHLPTYQWNVAQAFIGLVPVRIILLMPFIITRNIWASTGTHILNDWAIFALAAGAGMDAA